MGERIADLINSLNNIVWGPWMIALLFGTHVFLTIRLRFIQRYLGTAIRLSWAPKREGLGDISHFGALTTALAATIGTGNIIGVSGAVALGGPGAVLWMWLTGVFGISTKYAEALLSVKYRVRTSAGTMAGGPMYVLERGLPWKRLGRTLGVLFAIFASVAAFGIGCGVQANSIARMLQESYNVPRLATGLILMVLTAVVILGGIRWIARVCSRLVPFMAIAYIGGCLLLLAMKWETLLDSISLIVTSAFTGQAAIGGFAGATIKEAMRRGISRGLFSNESGMGSAPIVAAAAQTRNPVRQALVSSTGTFWDTVVICLLTGLVVVNSGEWQVVSDNELLVKTAFSDFGPLGTAILNFGLLTFVFSTILGWSYYGERSIEYLAGSRAIFPYRIAWVIVVLVGAVVQSSSIWNFADAANALMAVPNLIALLLLSNVVVAETRKYLWSGNLDLDSPDDAPVQTPRA